jgi:hypothetical protein
MGPGLTANANAGSGGPSLVEYVTALVDTMIEAHDRLYIATDDFARTIAIPTLGVSATNFALTRDQSNALYESGRRAAEDFLRTWDFAQYVATFRGGRTQTRRALATAPMGQRAASQTAASQTAASQAVEAAA